MLRAITTKETIKTYDVGCFELASNVLSDSTWPVNYSLEELEHALASRIQASIEDFFEEHGIK